MEKITYDDPRIEYPAFYNIYPIMNERSASGTIDPVAKFDDRALWLDEQYGRVITAQNSAVYGSSNKLPYYKTYDRFKVVDYVRVPFRKIPIFEANEFAQIDALYTKLKHDEPGYQVLLRGQTTVYSLHREEDENMFLFGENTPKEPSFHPSFLRAKFDEYFMYALWHSQTAMLLNDIGVDLKSLLNESQYKEYKIDEYKIKNSAHFTPIALGFAQHYGLPSVGLDLTDNLKVAAWFASHTLPIDDLGITNPTSIIDFGKSTIFFFRCPLDTVFSYDAIKPKHLTNTRPDRQKAWFGHCGWGMAKNQLASYLICGIRIDIRILNLFDDNYANHLFPSRETDLVLDFFLNMKENKRNKGEVERALKRIYHLDKKTRS
ncbi:FRG domain-containing protein [Inquilinus sp. KBS0705]|nr:FRG domain-containing protein [Inquilinus sp. KBS0705]